MTDSSSAFSLICPQRVLTLVSRAHDANGEDVENRLVICSLDAAFRVRASRGQEQFQDMRSEQLLQVSSN